MSIIDITLLRKPKLFKTSRSLIAQLTLARSLLRGNVAHQYRAYLVTDDDQRNQAKALHAQAYRRKGFIYEHDLDDSGYISHIADPHQLHAEYFVVREEGDHDQKVLVTVRQIMAHPNKGFDSFPILAQAHVEDEFQERLHQYDPADIIEISGLAKARGVPMAVTFLAYRAMWAYSKNQHHKIWLMALSPSLYGHLKRFVGPAIIQIGQPSEYTGEAVIPAMVDIARAEADLAQSAASLRPDRRYVYRTILQFFADDAPPVVQEKA